MSKKLVAYFSVSGVTAKVAKELVQVECATVETGTRLGSEVSEADLKLWTEGLAL